MSATPSRRQSSQAHPQSAQSRRRTSTHTSVSEARPLPEYQTPEAPLTAESQRQIATLLASHHLRNLRAHLQHAAEKLTHSGGEVNERLSDARVRYEKSKETRRSQGDENVDDDESNEEYQRLAELETRADAITARMEEKTRQVVDSEIKLQGLTDAMGQIEREEGENVATALGVRQTRQQRARRRANEDDDADGAEDPTDGDYEDAQERELRERNAQNPPSRKLVDKLTEGVQKWNELSLTERYASNNSYIGFYRMVHDSKFPGDDVPPLPHSSTWFGHMEDTNTRSGVPARTRNQNRRLSPADSDDDIAIERERISLKCPLTLTPYQDPVTSTKCPHSFEREAIMDMIKRSSTTIPPPASRRGQRRVHVVKCPVCSIPLSAEDLRPDPVLLRRVRRAQELQRREEEDDHLEGDGRKKKDRSTGITLGSDVESDDDAMDVDAPASQHIKKEPLSQAAAARSDESSDDAESAEGESEKGEDEEAEIEGEENGEVDMDAQDEETENGEVESDQGEIAQAQNGEEQTEEMETDESENEEAETNQGEIESAQNEEEQNEEMETDESDNEDVDNEPDNEEAETEDGEIEPAQNALEQKEETVTDSEHEVGSEEVPSKDTENEERNADGRSEAVKGDVEGGEGHEAVASQKAVPDENEQSDTESGSDSDGEGSEGSGSESGDSDIEPKVESGSEEESHSD
ncbi:uncharacterized protein N7500_006147 [Penicillium coprophilum]|uniref:uncharacterized protein n=1 Tax=Penicillium coprophilum TaxID=36646 RepID=UPI00239F410C|nr:uncharacterized protein N7500_006147 [Penicillium coprophilum]KAJ5164317.1 hypothetical protein N7500_006147 [Penicillium coprophilum]